MVKKYIIFLNYERQRKAFKFVRKVSLSFVGLVQVPQKKILLILTSFSSEMKTRVIVKMQVTHLQMKS